MFHLICNSGPQLSLNAAMITLLRREFTVNLSLKQAWQYLARVEEWPSWAKHIKRVKVRPSGELGAQSTGIIHLSNGMKSTLKITEFAPYRHWKWVGRFVCLTVHYDHIFEELDPQRTKLIWIVSAEGFGAPVFGKLFAKIYNWNLRRAIPELVKEMNTSRSKRDSARSGHA